MKTFHRESGTLDREGTTLSSSVQVEPCSQTDVEWRQAGRQDGGFMKGACEHDCNAEDTSASWDKEDNQWEDRAAKPVRERKAWMDGKSMLEFRITENT